MDYLQIYSTGPGAVNNALQTGAEAVATPPTATIGGVPAPVSFAGPALGFIGLYQVNVQVPQGMTDFPVTFARRMAISPHNAPTDLSMTSTVCHAKGSMRDPEIIDTELMEISAIADDIVKFERIVTWCATHPDEVPFALHQFMGRGNKHSSETPET